MRWGITIAAFALAASGARTQTAAPLRFEVQLAREAASAPVSGRLLVFITNVKQPLDTISTGFGGAFGGASTYTAAQEVEGLAPGEAVVINPDTLAYPAPLSSAPKGDWQAMALLDADHSFARSEQGPGDITSAVVKLSNLDSAHAGTIPLLLTRVTPAPRKRTVDGVTEVKFTSPILSRFWGRPVTMRAAVVMPPDASKRRWPAVYRVPGFGGGDEGAFWSSRSLRDRMKRGVIPSMAHVFLDPETSLGHTEFADSVNNGPWGAALTREFIPFLEKRFGLLTDARGRFLTGHSSGGWSTLWLQVNYPTFFNGTWSTGPDPVDFRSFCTINIDAKPLENAYVRPDGAARNLVRFGGADTMSFRDFARYEMVAGEYGGQMASFEAVFSPRGQDGRPMRLFNRHTGAIDPAVARAWRRYDIHRVLAAGGKPLMAKLKGKLHIIVGDRDNFHLNEAVVLLRDYLKSVHSDAYVEIVPGRDHMDLYTGGLENRILQAIGKRWNATGQAASPKRIEGSARAKGQTRQTLTKRERR
ncbi:MAG TPA: alpha/beta hydrolase [Armatimonadota bacterium]|jgi:hypothetical protein